MEAILDSCKNLQIFVDRCVTTSTTFTVQEDSELVTPDRNYLTDSFASRNPQPATCRWKVLWYCALLEYPSCSQKFINVRRLNIRKNFSEVLPGQFMRVTRHGEHDLAFEFVKQFPHAWLLEHRAVWRQGCDMTIVYCFYRVIWDMKIFPYYQY